jgi:hypothetical protein
MYSDYNQQYMNHFGLSDTGSPKIASLLGKMMINHETLGCLISRRLWSMMIDV